MITAIISGNSNYDEAHYLYINRILEHYYDLPLITKIIIGLTNENPAWNPKKYQRREGIDLKVVPLSTPEIDFSDMIGPIQTDFILRGFSSSTQEPLPSDILEAFIQDALASRKPQGILRMPALYPNMFYEITRVSEMNHFSYLDYKSPLKSQVEVSVFDQSLSRKACMDLLLAMSRSEDFLPSTVCIELSSRCNARCKKCSYRNEMTPDHEGFIDFNLFTRLVDEISGLNRNIRLALYLRGEPLIHPRISDIIKHLKQYPNIHSAINTNGIFSKSLLPMFNDLNAKITFNLDAVSAMDFNRNFGVDRYERVNANIRTLINQKNGNTHPMVSVMFCDSPYHRKGDFYFFLNEWINVADEVILSGFSEPKPFNDTFIRTFKQKYFTPKETTCMTPWDYMTILADGTVLFCSGIPDNDFKYGPIEIRGIADIWTSDFYENWRRTVVEHYDSPDFWCAHCDGWLCSNEESYAEIHDGMKIIKSPINEFYSRV